MRSVTCIAALLLGLVFLLVIGAQGQETRVPSAPVYLHWAYRCDGSIQTVPVVHEDTLYFGSMDGIVHAIDVKAPLTPDPSPKGRGEIRARWRTELGGMLLTPGVVDVKRKQLLIGCDDGHVYALSLVDGKIRWQHRLDGAWTVMAGPQIRGGPLLAGDVVLAVNMHGHVEAIRANDGESIWKAAGFGLVGGQATLNAAGDRLLFTSTERGLMCLDTATGKLAWDRKDLGRSVSTSAIAEGVAYVGSSTGIIVAVDLKTSKDVWRRSLGGMGRFAGQVVGAPLLVKDSVIVADIDGKIVALDRKDGQERWQARAPAGFWAGGRQVGKNAWFASTGGQLLAIDLERAGETRWVFDLKAPLWTPPLAHDGRLYQATDDGYLLCLAAEEPKKPMPRPPVQTALRFKHPAPRRGELLHEFIGTASGFKSQPFGGPPRESDLRGKQLHFTFQLKIERRAGDPVPVGPDGKEIPADQEVQIVSRPLTNYFDWNCSPTFTGLPLEWSKNPRVRVVGSYEQPVLNPYADAKTTPRPLCAYIIQKEPPALALAPGKGKGEKSEGLRIPPAHWPAWYVNNWVHFMCDINEVGHDRYFANTGYLNWGWDFVEERTMGQHLPRHVWAQVKPRYYLWRAVNGMRQVRDPATNILRGVPTTLTIYISGANHDDPYHSEADLRALSPKVSLQADQPKGKAPLEVKFRASVGDQKIPVVQWSFDSAKKLTVDSSEREPTYTYRAPGKYLVSLTAVSSAGTVSHAHIVIEVEK